MADTDFLIDETNIATWKGSTRWQIMRSPGVHSVLG
jgi:hypothetical protein